MGAGAKSWEQGCASAKMQVQVHPFEVHFLFFHRLHSLSQLYVALGLCHLNPKTDPRMRGAAQGKDWSIGPKSVYFHRRSRAWENYSLRVTG
jgi:hypothetical protein